MAKTMPCLMCGDIQNNDSQLCDDCEFKAQNDAEFEREMAAENERFERELADAAHAAEAYLYASRGR